MAGFEVTLHGRIEVPPEAMSLRPVIPRRVALQQSSPPLHQPSAILKEKSKNEKAKPLNCICANSELSQRRGSSRALQAPNVKHRIMKVATTRWDFPQGHAGEQSARKERIVGQP
jgi:hypothetical protein